MSGAKYIARRTSSGALLRQYRGSTFFPPPLSPRGTLWGVYPCVRDEERQSACDRRMLSFQTGVEDGDRDFQEVRDRRRPPSHAEGRMEVRARGRRNPHEPGG